MGRLNCGSEEGTVAAWAENAVRGGRTGTETVTPKHRPKSCRRKPGGTERRPPRPCGTFSGPDAAARVTEAQHPELEKSQTGFSGVQAKLV